MSEKVLNQIKYLCKMIPAVEWSGILFYSIEGTITKPEDMVITLQDILPMQKGTATYTEYSFDERVIEYMMENEESENWKMGHIHSHNTMAVFFSGTDWSELEDNAPNHNIYASLIVNNWMDFCAKVCFLAESETSTYTAKDENGKSYTYTSKVATKSTKLVVYDCDIISPTQLIVEDDFASKVDGIIETARKKAEAAKKVYNTQSVVGSRTVVGGTRVTYPQKGGTNSTVKKSVSPNHLTGGWGEDRWDEEDFAFDEQIPLSKSYTPPVGSKTAKFSSETDYFVDEFAMFALNTGNDIAAFADLSDVANFYIGFNVTGNMAAAIVIEKYLASFNKYYDLYSKRDDPAFLVEVTEGVVAEFKDTIEYEDDKAVIAFLKPVMAAISNFLTKLEQEYEFNKV